MKALVLLGRILFSIPFLFTAMNHFSSAGIGYATSMGVPAANVLVPLSGVIAMLGGLSILLGYKAKIGAWLIVIFLIPVTFMMHVFWNVNNDPATMMKQIQMSIFFRNMAMLGAALMITYFGSGPLSIDSAKPANP